MHMFVCKDTSVTLDRWVIWGRQGAGREKGMLELGGGVEGGYVRVVYAHWQERNGVYCGGWRVE